MVALLGPHESGFSDAWMAGTTYRTRASVRSLMRWPTARGARWCSCDWRTGNSVLSSRTTKGAPFGLVLLPLALRETILSSSCTPSVELEQLRSEVEQREKEFVEQRAENELIQRQLQTVEATLTQLNREIVEVSGSGGGGVVQTRPARIQHSFRRRASVRNCVQNATSP